MTEADHQYGAPKGADHVPGWRTGFVKRFPWLGFGAILAVLLSISAVAAVLTTSDGKPQTHWNRTLQPNVILGALDSFTNVMLSVAAANGITIAWWRRALHGTTVRDLHRSWSFSTSVFGIALNPQHFNIIALAALTLKLSVVNSILFQMATRTVLKEDVTQTTVYGYTNASFPVTAYTGGRAAKLGNLQQWFNVDVSQWLLSGVGGALPLEAMRFSGCNNTCLTTVSGLGFAFECNTTQSTSNYIDQANKVNAEITKGYPNATYPAAKNASSNLPLFAVSFDIYSGVNLTSNVDPGYLTMKTFSTRSTSLDNATRSTSCPADHVQHSCKLRPAIVEYDITIRNYTNKLIRNGILLGHHNSTNESTASNFGMIWDGSSNQLSGFRVKELIDVFEKTVYLASGAPRYFAGLQYVLANELGSGANITYSDPIGGWSLAQQGTTYQMMSEKAPISGGQCQYTNQDPINYVMLRINELMFYISSAPQEIVESTSALPSSQLAQYQAMSIENMIHYQTDYRFMAGALALVLGCILCILPTYWGFWQLGRPVTLSPIDVANAFRSPALEHTHAANGDVEDLVKEIGSRSVKYGKAAAGTGRLEIGDPSMVDDVHRR